jgi:hypothetical protein
MLPDELLVALQDEWPCRNVQLEQLSALLSVCWLSAPSASCLLTREFTITTTAIASVSSDIDGPRSEICGQE